MQMMLPPKKNVRRRKMAGNGRKEWPRRRRPLARSAAPWFLKIARRELRDLNAKMDRIARKLIGWRRSAAAAEATSQGHRRPCRLHTELCKWAGHPHPPPRCTTHRRRKFGAIETETR